LITVNAGDLGDRVANLTAVKSSLVGGGGPDAIIGGSNNDNLTGLAGADILRGMDGNDRLYAHDGTSDKVIDCDGDDAPGANDLADLDLLPKDPDDRVIGCETMNRH
jgi:serralysin